MKHKHPERERRPPLSPAAQLRNVIDALCDEELEAEIQVEDLQSAASTESSPLEAQLREIKAKADLMQFAKEYGKRLEIPRGKTVKPDVSPDDDPQTSAGDGETEACKPSASKNH